MKNQVYITASGVCVFPATIEPIVAELLDEYLSKAAKDDATLEGFLSSRYANSNLLAERGIPDAVICGAALIVWVGRYSQTVDTPPQN